MKLDRAKQRMKELEEALQSFYATNPFKFSGKADLQAGKVVYTMDSVKDAPDEKRSHRRRFTFGNNEDNCLESKSIRTTPVLGHMTILWMGGSMK